MRNLLINSGSHPMSTQPSTGGPAYFIRNIAYHAPGGSTRLTNGSPGVLFYNNTILTETAAGSAANVHWRNNLILDRQPDLAIIDGLLPGIHGFDLCKKIKDDPSITKKPKVVLMSSVYTGQKYKFEVAEFKADAFMIKPFSKEDLLSRVTALLT